MPRIDISKTADKVTLSPYYPVEMSKNKQKNPKQKLVKIVL